MGMQIMPHCLTNSLCTQEKHVKLDHVLCYLSHFLPLRVVFFPHTNVAFTTFYFRVPVYLPPEVGGNSTVSVISNVSSEISSAPLFVPPQNLGWSSKPYKQNV